MQSAIMYKKVIKKYRFVYLLGGDREITDTMCYYTEHLLQAG